MSLARTLGAILLVALLVPVGAAPGMAQQDTDPPAGAGAGPAQDGAAGDAQQPPTFRGGVDFVRVDVLVHGRDDEPVTDLTQADFQIFEDDTPQQIEQFSVIRIDGSTQASAPPPRNEIRTRADEERVVGSEDARVFVLFMDDYHVHKGNSMQVRLPLTQFLQTQLGPNDVVAVMYPLMSVQELRFTRDHESVVQALEAFRGRKYDYTPTNEFERRYERASSEVVERIRNQVVMTALRGLAVRLGGLREGRKSVIFVSEGFTVLLPPQMRRADAAQPINPFVTTEADPRVERTVEAFSEAELYNELRLVFDAANRNNTAIYSLDPRGLAVFEFDIDDVGGGPLPDFATDRRVLQLTQDTLRTLSEQTDGRAIVNRNRLGEGLAKIVEDASFYYLIGYTSSQPPDDGKFHEIRVRVNRPDVEVRARKGFWALTPEEAKRAATAPSAPVVAGPVQAALASIAPAVRAGKFVKTWLGTDRGTGGRTRVTLVWEPLPTPPGERREAASGVSLLVSNEAGDLLYRGRAPERGASAGDEAPHRLVFETAPGEVEVRLTVEGPGGTLDQELSTLDVPDFTVPEPRLGTPRVFRGRTVAELRALAANADAVPIALREFSRTERLLIRFDAYGPGGALVSPTAALLNRGGDRMAEIPVTAAPVGGTHQVDLGLAGLAPGEYLVEISVAGAGGELSELVPLRIGS